MVSKELLVISTLNFFGFCTIEGYLYFLNLMISFGTLRSRSERPKGRRPVGASIFLKNDDKIAGQS